MEAVNGLPAAADGAEISVLLAEQEAQPIQRMLRRRNTELIIRSLSPPALTSTSRGAWWHHGQPQCSIGHYTRR